MTRLQNSIQKIIAKRNLNDKEKVALKNEIETYQVKAAFIAKTLDKYVEEIEKLLQQAKK